MVCVCTDRDGGGKWCVCTDRDGGGKWCVRTDRDGGGKWCVCTDRDGGGKWCVCVCVCTYHLVDLSALVHQRTIQHSPLYSIEG